MRRKNIVLTILTLLLLGVRPLSAKLQYTPSLSYDTCLTLTQNRTVSNFDLPLRTSFCFDINVTPASFTTEKGFLFELELGLLANSESITWNNTQLMGYEGVASNFLIGGDIKNYQIKGGVGLTFNHYRSEDYFFFSLNAILKQSFFLTTKIAITVPFRFTYRQEVFDYRIGFGLTYYPIGGKEL